MKIILSLCFVLFASAFYTNAKSIKDTTSPIDKLDIDLGQIIDTLNTVINDFIKSLPEPVSIPRLINGSVAFTDLILDGANDVAITFSSQGLLIKKTAFEIKFSKLVKKDQKDLSLSLLGSDNLELHFGETTTVTNLVISGSFVIKEIETGTYAIQELETLLQIGSAEFSIDVGLEDLVKLLNEQFADLVNRYAPRLSTVISPWIQLGINKALSLVSITDFPKDDAGRVKRLNDIAADLITNIKPHIENSVFVNVTADINNVKLSGLNTAAYHVGLKLLPPGLGHTLDIPKLTLSGDYDILLGSDLNDTIDGPVALKGTDNSVEVVDLQFTLNHLLSIQSMSLHAKTVTFNIHGLSVGDKKIADDEVNDILNKEFPILWEEIETTLAGSLSGLINFVIDLIVEIIQNNTDTNE